MQEDKKIVLKEILRHRFFILLFAAFCAIIAAIGTSKFFMSPVFSSEIIFYPPSAAINRSFDNVKSFMVQDKEIEEHLQTILSGKTEDILISKHHLASHYNIDTTEYDWRDELKKTWEDNFKVSRTRYNSISIVVFDTDKYMAAQIANDAANIADSIKSDLLKTSLRNNSEALKIQLQLKYATADSVASSLGLDAAAIAFAPSLTGNSAIDLAQKQEAINQLLEEKNKGRVANRQQQLYTLANLLRQLYDMENAVSQLQIALSSPPLSSYVLSKAEPSFKKASPKRSLITTLSFIAGLFFAMAWILFKQQWNKIKMQLQ